MTSVEWMNAAKLALEILAQERMGQITKTQAARLLESFGFSGLLKTDDARSVG